MPQTKKPFANDQQQMLAARVEWEIRQMIFLHLKHKADYGYPFATPNEMMEQYASDQLNATIALDELFIATGKMRQEYGEAFCYIAFREISNVINAFLEVAERQSKIHPKDVEPVEAKG